MKKIRWHFFLGLVGMCLKKSRKLHTVFMIYAILFKTEQSCKLQKPILANQDAIWKTRLVHVDHITVEILCIKLQEFWTKSVGAV